MNFKNSNFGGGGLLINSSSNKFKIFLSIAVVFMFVTTAFAVVVDDIEVDGTTPTTQWSNENYRDTGWASNYKDNEGPFTISDAADLAQLAFIVNSYNKTSNPEANFSGKIIKIDGEVDLIDLSEHLWTPIGIYDYVNNSKSFSGTFDGNEKTITGLTISTDSGASGYAAGLFGYIEGGTVKNVNLVNTNITSSKDHVGGIAGYSENGSIQNCTNTGDTSISVPSNSDYSRVGGIVGNNNGGTVQGCNNTGTIEASGTGVTNCAGGIVGYNQYAIVQDSYNTGTIEASGGTSNYAGGIVGYNEGNVLNCYNKNTGTIEASGTGTNNAGGIAGIVDGGKIHNCYNIGTGTPTVKASGETNTNYAGGIVGDVENGTTKNCYNTATVEASSTGANDNHAGGIAGIVIDGKTQNCYNVGTIEASGTGVTNCAGGIVGYNQYATVNYCYWEGIDEDTPPCVGHGTAGDDCIHFGSTIIDGNYTLSEASIHSQSTSLLKTLNENVIELNDGENEKLNAWKQGVGTNSGPELTNSPPNPSEPEDPSTPGDPLNPDNPSSATHKVTFPPLSGEGYSIRTSSTTISNELSFSIFVEGGYSLGNVTASNGEVQYMGGGSYILKNVTSDTQVYVNVMKTTSNIDNSGMETVLVAIAALVVVILLLLAYAWIVKKDQD